jgi:hypothetical protein
MEGHGVKKLSADHSADRKDLVRATCRSALFRELSIATHRSIARTINKRSGMLPEHVSAQPTTELSNVEGSSLALPFLSLHILLYFRLTKLAQALHRDNECFQ